MCNGKYNAIETYKLDCSLQYRCMSFKVPCQNVTSLNLHPALFIMVSMVIALVGILSSNGTLNVNVTLLILTPCIVHNGIHGDRISGDIKCKMYYH